MTPNLVLLVAYAASLLIMSLASFITFNHDKKLAIKGAMRVKEKTLLGLTVLNGALGSLIGRKVAHHKTDKIYFSITIYMALVCQVAVLAALAYFAF